MKQTFTLCLISLLASCHSIEATEPADRVPLKWSPEEFSKASAQPSSDPEKEQADKPQPSPLQDEAVPIEARLEKLASLFTAGLLTEAEYTKAKATALNSTPLVETSPDEIAPVSPKKEPLPLAVFENTASPIVKITENGTFAINDHATQPEEPSGHKTLSFTQACWIQHSDFSGYELELSRESSDSTFLACSAALTTPDNYSDLDFYLLTLEGGFYQRANENSTIYGSVFLAHEIIDASYDTISDSYFFVRGGGIYLPTENLALDLELNYSLSEATIDPYGFARARYLLNDKVSVGIEVNVFGDFREDSLVFGLRFND